MVTRVGFGNRFQTPGGAVSYLVAVFLRGTGLSTEPGFMEPGCPRNRVSEGYIHILFSGTAGPARTPHETRLPGAQPGSVIKEGRNPVAPALKLRGLEPGL